MNKKASFSCFLFFALLIGSCLKNRDDPSAELPSGNWIFNGGNYSSTTVSKEGSNIHFIQDTDNGVWTLFKSPPSTQTGSYKVVMGPAVALANDEMVLQVDRGKGESWYSTGSGNFIATVKKNSLGSIEITVPSVTVRHYKDGIVQSDSAISSCVLIYK